MFFDTYIDITPPATSGWQTVDLTAHGVPANAVAIIRMYCTSHTTYYAIGARKFGSTDNRGNINYYHQAPITVGCDAASKIDLYRIDTVINYYLCGYILSTDVTYFDNGYDKSPVGTGWSTITCSEVPVGATYAIFETIYGYGSGVDFRKTGSTDVRNPRSQTGHPWWVVGLNGSKQCDIWLEAATAASTFLVGYIVIGTPKTNALDISLTPTGSYEVIDLSADAPSNAVAAIVLVNQDIYNYGFDLRKNSIVQEFYYQGMGCNGVYVVPLDIDKKIEGKIESTYVDFWVLGYLNGILPTAEFSADVTIGNVPLTVVFTDESTGGATYWEWDFGDGSAKSYVQNPTHIYTADGVHTVKLIVSNEVGYDDEEKIGYITVCNTATADLTLPSLECVADSWFALLELPIFQCAAGGYWTNYTRMTLPILTMVAAGGPVTNDARITLPSLTIIGKGESGQWANADLTLPPIWATGTGIERGYADLTLPALTCSATATSSSVINGDMTLPIFTADGFAIAASVGEADLTLPSLTCIGYAPAMAVMTLPILQVTGIGLCGEVGEADIQLSQLEVLGTGYGIPKVVSTHIILPRLVTAGTGINGNVGTADLTLQLFTFVGQAYNGAIGTARLTLPMETIVANGYGEYIGEADLILPIFQMEAFGRGILPATYEVYVMNLKNFAISTYEGFNYNSFCNYKNLYLGGSPDGIFVLEGDDDDGTDIDATMKTGIEDLGITKLKNISDAYIALKAGGIYELRVITSDGNEQVYIIEDNNASLHTLKQGLAKGAKARYMTLQFKNKNGSDFEGDNIVLYVDVLSRNV